MRADHAVRHNAAVGALVGLAVGDALAAMTDTPPTVCGGPGEAMGWSTEAASSFEHAERLLNGDPVAIDVGPVGIVAAALALADPDTPPPLLADPDAALMCSMIRAGLLGDLHIEPGQTADATMAGAVAAAANSDSFIEAIKAAEPTEYSLTGALAGLRWGPAAIPVAWATRVHGPVGARTYGLRQLRRLAERLTRFLADHPDGAVISLCPTTGAFDNHTIRREFFLHDAAGSKVNPRLPFILDEILDTITTFHNEDRPVLVHCHHGASRTGFVLRAWLVREFGLSYDDATSEAQVRWPKTSTWNKAFCREVERRCEVSAAESL